MIAFLTARPCGLAERKKLGRSVLNNSHFYCQILKIYTASYFKKLVSNRLNFYVD